MHRGDEMKTLLKIYGLAIVIFLFVMIAMQYTDFTVREDELNSNITSAMTATQIVMQENIEDKVFGTDNKRKEISSNEEYVEEFANNFYVLVSTNTDYEIEVYAVDYEKGLLSVGVKGTFKMLNGQTKTIYSRKTSIVDVIQD